MKGTTVYPIQAKGKGIDCPLQRWANTPEGMFAECMRTKEHCSYPDEPPPDACPLREGDVVLTLV